MASVMDCVGGKGSNREDPLQGSKGLSFGGPGPNIPQACYCQRWSSAMVISVGHQRWAVRRDTLGNKFDRLVPCKQCSTLFNSNLVCA